MEIPRFILEVGVGNGGNHLERVNRGTKIYYVNDQNLAMLDDVLLKYPGVFPLPGPVQELDLPVGYFDQIEIRFPIGTLLVPGLQKRARDIRGWGDELQQWCPDDMISPQWYERFAKTLAESGKVIIWGDEFVDLDEMQKLCSPHFRVDSCVPLTHYDLEEMGTDTSLTKARTWVEGTTSGQIIDIPKRITLVKA